MLGVLASEGRENVLVRKSPKVVLISTGDELVSVSQKPLDFQIRLSNTHALKAELELRGHTDIDLLHLKDDPETLFKKFKNALESYDLVIITGGVSKGKFDYVPSILSDLGVSKYFIRYNRDRESQCGLVSTLKEVSSLDFQEICLLYCLSAKVCAPLDGEFLKKDQKKKVILKEDFTFSKGFNFISACQY